MDSTQVKEGEVNKWLQFIIGILAAGAVQFGLLATAAVATGAAVDAKAWLIIIAGVIGAMGTTAAGLLKQLPREEWPPEKREPTKEPA